jgi:hypothetical protein
MEENELKKISIDVKVLVEEEINNFSKKYIVKYLDETNIDEGDLGYIIRILEKTNFFKNDKFVSDIHVTCSNNTLRFSAYHNGEDLSKGMVEKIVEKLKSKYNVKINLKIFSAKEYNETFGS